MQIIALKFALLVIICVDFAWCYVLYHDATKYEGSTCITADKRRGRCRSGCPTLTDQQRGNRQNICGFKDSVVLLCCPEDLFNSSVLYPTIEYSCYEVGRTIQRRQNAYPAGQSAGFYIADLAFDDVFYRWETHSQCGREAAQISGKNGKIYSSICKSFERPFTIWIKDGGESLAVIVKEFPHMAALGWSQSNNSTEWYCGGTLVHVSFVLTAAHCISNIGKPPDIARIGDVNLKSDSDDVIKVDYDVEAVFMHDHYTPRYHYNDIALLKVKKRPEYREQHSPSPACIWLEPEFPVEKLWWLGYGAPAFGQTFNYKLYKGELSLIKSEECSTYYNDTTELPSKIIESQICALDHSGKVDTCEGDSGGPLQFQQHFRTYVVAVTSFGRLCLDGTPGVYTRVFSFLSWMEKIMSENQ